GVAAYPRASERATVQQEAKDPIRNNLAFEPPRHPRQLRGSSLEILQCARLLTPYFECVSTLSGRRPFRIASYASGLSDENVSPLMLRSRDDTQAPPCEAPTEPRAEQTPPSPPELHSIP